MKFVDPKNDVAFRKIFGSEQSHDILIEFLNAILDLPYPIESVKITNPFLYPLIKGLKETILDVHASDQDGNKFIIEMQVEGASGFDKRIVYYSSKAYVSGLPKGKLYKELKPVIFLGILNFTLFDHAHYISRHLILNKETGLPIDSIAQLRHHRVKP